MLVMLGLAALVVFVTFMMYRSWIIAYEYVA